MIEDNKLSVMNGSIMPHIADGNALAKQYPVDKEAMIKAMAKTDENLALIAKSKNIFQRGHSNFGWRALVLTHEDDLMNMEQVNNQLNDRQMALIENLIRFEDRDLEADELEEKAGLKKYENRPKKRKRLLAKSRNIRKQARMAYAPVMGCLKDIDYLTSWYKKLESKIIKEHGKFDESIREKLQERYYIKRLLLQSLRDIREWRGHITVGNQRALEQVGIDPTWAETHLRRILDLRREYYQEKRINEESDVSTAVLETEIDSLSKNLDGIHGNKLKRMGLEEDQVETLLYVEDSK